MRFHAILSLTLLSSIPINSYPIHPRDLSTIVNAVNTVSESLNSFTRTVKTLKTSTNLTQFATDLTAKSTGIFTSLKNGAAIINETSGITMSEALQLTTAADQLSDACLAVVNSLINKKAILEKAGYTATLSRQMGRQITAVKEFNQFLTEKVPEEAKEIVREQGRVVMDALARGINVFGGTPKATKRGFAEHFGVLTEAEEAQSVEVGRWGKGVVVALNVAYDLGGILLERIL